MSNPPEKQIKLRNGVVIGLIGLLIVVWVIWSQWDRVRDEPPVLPVESATGELDAPDPGNAESPTGVSAAGRLWTEQLGQPPSWPDDLAAPSQCESAESDLLRVCALLDSRDFIASAAVPGGACGLLRDAADVLVSRPPVLTSELKSYHSIISNVYHLFRVLGRERLSLLRRIVNEEPQLAEPAAMAVYRWLATRESCARSGQSAIRLPALYDYAGFLFETMGGQALLRRRTPETEALVGFYALLIIDRADLEGHNPHGVDPRQEISRTRALLAGGDWVFGERYDSMLAEMAARWEKRSVE